MTKSHLIEESHLRNSIRRMFENSPKEAAAELLQNSQRANATEVESVVDMANYRFTYRDNGHGIASSNDSWYKLLSLGASGFRDTAAEQDPMGLGINALLSMEDAKYVSIESNGRMIVIDVARWWSDESYYSKWQSLIKPCPQTPTGFLIEVQFNRQSANIEDKLQKFNDAFADNGSGVAVGYHDLKVVHNSRELTYRFRPDEAILSTTEFKGNLLSLYVGKSYHYTWRSNSATVNWYGQLINVQSPGPLAFYYEVNRGTPLTPKSPARSGIITDQLLTEFNDFVEQQIYEVLYEELKPLCDEVVAKGWCHSREITRAENPQELSPLLQSVDIREANWFGLYYNWMQSRIKPGRSPLPLIRLTDAVRSDWTSNRPLGKGTYFYHDDAKPKPNLFSVRECPIMLGWATRRVLPQTLSAEEVRRLMQVNEISQRLTETCGITYANEYEFGLESLRAEADLLDEQNQTNTVWVTNAAGSPVPGLTHTAVWVPGEPIEEGSTLETYKPGHWALLRYPEDQEQEVSIEWHPVQEYIALFNETATDITGVEGLAIGAESLFDFLTECDLFAYSDPYEDEDYAEEYWRKSLMEEQRALMGNALPQNFNYRDLHSRVIQEHYKGKPHNPDKEELVIHQLKYIRTKEQFMPSSIEVSYSVQSEHSTSHFQTNIKLFGE